MQSGECTRQMQWSRQVSRSELTHPAIGRHEIKMLLRLKQMSDPNGMKKVGKICTAAHTDMLTHVDELAGRVLERSGASAEPLFCLNNRDHEAALCQGRRRRQPRQPRSHYHDAVRHS